MFLVFKLQNFSLETEFKELGVGAITIETEGERLEMNTSSS